MYDTVFMHRTATTNVGDLWCSPGRYFEFGTQFTCDIAQTAPPAKLAVLGGGQVFKECAEAVIYHTANVKHRVIWGVGISSADAASIDFDIMSPSCAMVGSRNWRIPGCEFVPCASAMSPLFDAAPAPTRDVVLFTHAQKSRAVHRELGVPEMSNVDVTMEEAIAFLASGETVVTNSYHGTFWAMCLGRKVLCLPFSRKFSGFRRAPVFGEPKGWIKQLHLAEAHPATLPKARAKNQAFYEKVRNLI
ncbi:MAG: hypothetical protein AB8B51_10365 [Sedimentitalea sp.]